MTDEFKDTVIVVTGAAGGVGQAVSGWLAARGARVFDLDRRQPAPAVGEFVPADVLDPDSIDDGVATVVAKAGRIDGLVAAAGLSEEPTPAEDMPVEVWQRTIDVNLTGVFLTCQRIGRVMLDQGRGRIVTIASMSGAHVVNNPQQQVAYNSSKAGGCRHDEVARLRMGGPRRTRQRLVPGLRRHPAARQQGRHAPDLERGHTVGPVC